VLIKALKQAAFGCMAMVILASAAQARQAQQESVDLAVLPAEAKATLSLIRQGGPFPFEKDGVVFGNYERRLPAQRRGYYHEYTVPTPRIRSRGARRIIAGGNPPDRVDYFYTGDHYASFQRIQEK
jgi:ribonuclease T1